MSGVLLCPLLFLSESGPRLVVSSSNPPASSSPSERVINIFSYIQLFIWVLGSTLSLRSHSKCFYPLSHCSSTHIPFFFSSETEFYVAFWLCSNSLYSEG